MATSRRNGLERRDALLDAALACFIERGIVATGIEDVRKAAGASPSSVYHLFDGLNQLVVALLARTFERLLGHMTARVLAADTAERAVRALVESHLEWVTAHRDQARFMYQAMALELAGPDRERLLQRKAELKQPLLEHLGANVARAAPGWPVVALELVLLGPSHEACRRWLAGGEVDLEWMRATLPELAWRSIAPPAPAQPARPAPPRRRARPRARITRST
ncbi:MAG TPA: TetR/AcrR family transcriptional regulator [Kofleriaceae bacterium]|nr:TetR/AcrR family transcriptional regulator [Kofleriaceae bacterium]